MSVRVRAAAGSQSDILTVERVDGFGLVGENGFGRQFFPVGGDLGLVGDEIVVLRLLGFGLVDVGQADRGW